MHVRRMTEAQQAIDAASIAPGHQPTLSKCFVSYHYAWYRFAD